MSTRSPVRLEAFVDECERPALIAAGQQLSEVLGEGSTSPWPVHLVFSRFDAARSVTPGALLIASPLKDIAPLERPFPDIEALWRRWIDSLAGSGSILLLATLFRAVPAGEDRRVVERIRRLNLLMIDLSHAHATHVIDLDRSLTAFGAMALATDHRLRGAMGSEAAGHAIVTALLAADLGPEIPGGLREAAARRHGGLPQLWPAVQSRIRRRERAIR